MEQAKLNTWPLCEHSRFVRSRPHEWHIQTMGAGETMLLLHGTGASTHSWRDIMPILATHYRVVAVDLPGHGFTRLGSKMRSSLEHVSTDLAALLQQESITPSVIVGHSAGAAIALRLGMRTFPDATLIGINPALEPFQGLAGVMFPVVARMVAVTPGAVSVIARSLENPGRVISLLRGTGSDVPAANMNLYARLFRDRNHVEGTLMMLSQWSLDGLLDDLPRIRNTTVFITGSRDRMVPPIGAVEAAHRMPNAVVQSVDGCGHLVHEEAPEAVARRIIAALKAN
ncbi:alpha/beta fold hydrolase BchO [Cognatishimia sp. F0-27]|uniref:alpha/beta fold hydrolase BchO n=1 Tax=Cognatishimia sp. F0-27 TaxID=2816855 RepID=UPI001D0C3034|nr:alpha/beta fold hydrolase BchO [Cognatishimia sp. F0-27]MCC1492440.1 alpha/beta fold hydrolase [Cognatishimia sp. F0-27]